MRARRAGPGRAAALVAGAALLVVGAAIDMGLGVALLVRASGQWLSASRLAPAVGVASLLLIAGVTYGTRFDKVLLSRSGLTRLVDRLEREGLVRREACETDARGLFAVLTNEGFDRLRTAAPTHLRGIEDYVVSRFDDAELAALGALLGRLLPDAADEGTCGEELSA